MPENGSEMRYIPAEPLECGISNDALVAEPHLTTLELHTYFLQPKRMNFKGHCERRKEPKESRIPLQFVRNS